jgi:tRNA uridine 5-carbamoylmethylation protein Kti12
VGELFLHYNTKVVHCFTSEPFLRSHFEGSEEKEGCGVSVGGEPTCPPQMLLLLCGLPGSGKTSLARGVGNQVGLSKSFIGNLFCPFFRCVHVEFDTFEGDFQEKRAQAQAVVEIELNKGGGLVVCDDNNFYHSMRKVYKNLAKKLNKAFLVVFLTVPVDEAVRRNHFRVSQPGFPVTTETILSMEEKMDKPSPGESVVVLSSLAELDELVRSVFLLCLKVSKLFQQQNVLREEEVQNKVGEETDRMVEDVKRKKRIKEQVRLAKLNGVCGKELNKIALSYFCFISFWESFSTTTFCCIVFLN